MGSSFNMNTVTFLDTGVLGSLPACATPIRDAESPLLVLTHETGFISDLRSIVSGLGFAVSQVEDCKP